MPPTTPATMPPTSPPSSLPRRPARSAGRAPRQAIPLGDSHPFAPTPDAPLRARLRALAQDSHFEPHRHDWGQLACCASGLLQVTVHADGDAPGGHDIAVTLPPHRAVWIPPGALHAVAVIEAARSRTVYVDPSVAPAGWAQPRVLSLGPLLQAMIDALEQPDYRADSAQRRALIALMLHELRQAPTLPLGVPMPAVGQGDRRLRHLCEAVMQSPGAHGRLAQWARQIGASERTLARLFRTELGMGFQRWRQQAVLARALPRLALGVPVGEVASECGYASESAFSAMFKAAMGASPRQFRTSTDTVAGAEPAAGTIPA